VVEWSQTRLAAYEEKVKELKGQGLKETDAKEKAAHDLEIYDVENLKVSHDDMLNAGGDVGDKLIFYLRTTKVKSPISKREEPLLDPDRLILTYQYRDRKMGSGSIGDGFAIKGPTSNKVSSRSDPPPVSHDWKMQCTTIEPLNPGSSRDSFTSYAVLRDDYNEHFYAILPKGYLPSTSGNG
jgi:hypothetical protein